MTRVFVILFLFNLSVLKTLGQSITWEKYFHFSRYASPDFIVEDNDGGFLMTANYDGPAANVYLVKLDRYGVVQWTKPLTPEIGWITSFCKSGNNDFFLLDYNLNHTKLLHFDREGKIVWSKNFYDNQSNYSPSLVYPLSGGNYIVQGGLFSDTNRFAKSAQTLVIEKFNAQHERIWGDTIPYTGYAFIFDIAQRRDNTLLFSGTLERDNTLTIGQALLLMVDTMGKITRNIVYPFTQDSSVFIQYITQLQNGDLILQSSDWSRFNAYFTRADSNGSILNHYPLQYINNYGGIIADGDSVYHFNAIGLFEGPLILIKYDTGFNTLGYRLFSNKLAFASDPKQILRTKDGGMLLFGGRVFQHDFPDEEYDDIIVIKLDKDGNLQGPPANDACLHVYPNPARQYIHFDNIGLPDSTLVYSSPDSTSYKVPHIYNLDIFDAMGRDIISYPHIELNGAQKDIHFLTNGLYLYRIYDDKMIYCSGKFVKD